MCEEQGRSGIVRYQKEIDREMLAERLGTSGQRTAGTGQGRGFSPHDGGGGCGRVRVAPARGGIDGAHDGASKQLRRCRRNRS